MCCFNALRRNVAAYAKLWWETKIFLSLMWYHWFPWFWADLWLLSEASVSHVDFFYHRPTFHNVFHSFTHLCLQNILINQQVLVPTNSFHNGTSNSHIEIELELDYIYFFSWWCDASIHCHASWCLRILYTIKATFYLVPNFSAKRSAHCRW